MLDVRILPEEELLAHARDALKAKQYAPARDLFAEYCTRFADARIPVPPGIVASYALARGHTREMKPALEMCRRALSADRTNPYIHACLAELYLLAGSRRQAVESVRRGLACSPDYPVLLRLRKELGIRQRRPIAFLPRANPINVALGRALRRMRSSERARST
jgi:tetratricopeptide (TPR) repeat protein